ncbi:hypothetical protein ABTZ58_11215 [Streptomyces sp. NPDC094143]
MHPISVLCSLRHVRRELVRHGRLDERLSAGRGRACGRPGSTT